MKPDRIDRDIRCISLATERLERDHNQNSIDVRATLCHYKSALVSYLRVDKSVESTDEQKQKASDAFSEFLEIMNRIEDDQPHLPYVVDEAFIELIDTYTALVLEGEANEKTQVNIHDSVEDFAAIKRVYERNKQKNEKLKTITNKKINDWIDREAGAPSNLTFKKN